MQGLGPLVNDGFGSIDTEAALGAGLVDSCSGYHGRPKGSAGHGGHGGEGGTRPDSRDAPHLFGIGLVEMLADEMTRKLQSIRDKAIAKAQQQNHKKRRMLIAKGVKFG